MAEKMTTVGWLETVSLPDWGIKTLVAKIDTGAKTSSIHVENLQPLDDNHIQFDVVMSRRNPNKRVTITEKIVRDVVVKSSTGTKTHRYVVQTTMVLGGVSKVIELTLTSRKRMLRRMLVGRQALEHTFLVDAGKTHLTE